MRIINLFLPPGISCANNTFISGIVKGSHEAALSHAICVRIIHDLKASAIDKCRHNYKATQRTALSMLVPHKVDTVQAQTCENQTARRVLPRSRMETEAFKPQSLKKILRVRIMSPITASLKYFFLSDFV